MFSASFPTPLFFAMEWYKKYGIRSLFSGRHFSKVFSEMFKFIIIIQVLLKECFEAQVHMPYQCSPQLMAYLDLKSILEKQTRSKKNKRGKKKKKKEYHSSDTSQEEERDSPDKFLSVKVSDGNYYDSNNKATTSSCFCAQYRVLFFMKPFSRSSLIAYSTVSTDQSLCRCCRLNSS